MKGQRRVTSSRISHEPAADTSPIRAPAEACKQAVFVANEVLPLRVRRVTPSALETFERLSHNLTQSELRKLLHQQVCCDVRSGSKESTQHLQHGNTSAAGLSLTLVGNDPASDLDLLAKVPRHSPLAG